MAHFSINREGNGNYKTRCRWIDFDNEKDKLTISQMIMIKGKKGVKVKAELLTDTSGVKAAYYMRCKGGDKWFPKSCVNISIVSGTMDIQKWLYEKTPEFLK